MGILDRLFGRRRPEPEPRWPSAIDRESADRAGARSPDEQAIERYRYLLRTAPPETIEQAHAEAFAQLTPEQRRMVLQELSRELPEHERAARYDDDPRSLARLATRAEMRQPGTLERTFGGMTPPGIGFGGLMAGSFLSSFAGVILGSMVAQAFVADSGYDQGFAEGYEAGEAADQQDATDAADQDAAFGETGDPGADFADAGGDFGTDFGGGDFGSDF